MKLPRALLVMLLSLAASTVVRSATTDPVGYASSELLPGVKGALPVWMVKNYTARGFVTAVGSDYVELPSSLPAGLMGSGGSAFLEIRTGPGTGVTLPVAGFAGNRVTLGRSAQGLVAVGVDVAVRSDWTIGELIPDPVASGIVTGETHETADTLGILDPATQVMRVFYYKTDFGWREVGREGEGDKSSVAIPFPTSLLYYRRGSTKLRFTQTGTVPMPYDSRRKVYVWPGRNLIAGPVTSVGRVDDWIDASTLVSAPSAPKSDSLRLTYADGQESPVVYFRKNQGWRFVGEAGDASSTRVDFSQSIDFQRVGPAGYVDFTPVVLSPPLALLAPATGTVLPVDPDKSDFVAGLVGWASQMGKKYQLQIQPLGSSAWQNHGEVVTAEGDTTRSLCRPEGNGLIRVLELP